MKLNQNSISAKTYRWFYMTKDMPTNLCPYFWKLVIAYTLLIPVSLVTLVYQIAYHKNDGPADSPGERFVLGALFWFALYVVIAMLSPILLLWLSPEKDTLLMSTVCAGVVLWLLAIILGAANLIKYLKERREDRLYKKNNYDENGNWIPIEDRVKEKRSYILIEMVKATYYKYCPKIDWE